MTRRRRKILLTLLLLGCVGSVAGVGMWSAFTATTTNTGNSYASGTVIISQHAGATTLYDGSDKGPGSNGTTVACVRVTYTGTLPATVKLYSSAVTNGTAFNLEVERGSGLTSPDNTMNCTGFTSSSVAFNGTLDTFPTTYAAGIDGKASGAAWSQNDSVDYRFTISVVDDTTPNDRTSALSTGTHSFTWEARNN